MTGEDFMEALADYVRYAIMVYRPSCDDRFLHPGDDYKGMREAAEKIKSYIDEMEDNRLTHGWEGRDGMPR